MVLIIGATGFVGVYTVEHFRKQGIEVFATGSNKIVKEYYKSIGVPTVDFRLEREEDLKNLPTKDIEAVIVLGALISVNVDSDPSVDDRSADYFRINTVGIANVLEFCRRNGIKKMISTTSYNDVRKSWAKGVALTEDEPKNFDFTGDHCSYIISKNAALDLQEYYHQQHGMQTAAFRLPAVYGVGPHGNIFVDGKFYKSAIQAWVEKAQAGEDIEIWGDPLLSRDLVYVKDVATALGQAIRSERANGLYNITNGVAVTLKEQAETVIELFSKPDNRSKIVYRHELKNNSPSYLFDISKAGRDFGYSPVYADFKTMMIDYKTELEQNRIGLFEDRQKC